MDFDDVSTGSTWSWLPAACAAALATLDVFEREPVLENVMALEAAGLEGLRGARGPLRRDRRRPRVGCFMAIEFVRDRVTKERDLELQERVARGCIRRGLLLDPSHDVAQHPAVARDAGRRDGDRARHPRRGDRRGAHRVNDAETRTWVARELLDLVAIHSPSEKEHDAVDHLAARCEAWGLPVRRLPVDGAADDLLIGWSDRARPLAHGPHRHRHADVVVGGGARRRPGPRPRAPATARARSSRSRSACCSRCERGVDLEAMPGRARRVRRRGAAGTRLDRDGERAPARVG